MHDWAIVSEAWRSTVGFFGWNWRTLVLPVFFFLGAFFHYLYSGFDAVWGEIMIMVLYGLAPVGAFAILLFFWNVFLAPYKILYRKLENHSLVGGEGARKPKKPSILWRDIDPLYLWQAAGLLLDREPVLEETMRTGSESYAAFASLQSAVNANEISSEPAANYDSRFDRITKQDFIDYCEKKFGKKPSIYGDE